MPKIVDVEKKRKELAINSIELFLSKGFHQLTVGEVAKHSNIAKGSIYKYFESKEDIVYAIIDYAQEEYDLDILAKIKNEKDIETKILTLFSLCIAEDEETIQRRKIYKQFINIALQSNDEKMHSLLRDIKTKYTTWLKEIFEEGIKQEVLKKESINLYEGLFTIGEGVLLYSDVENYNRKDLLTNHISSLMNFIKQ
jgi:AcrR family transcriptional regulator